jgi:hypothetical protein
MTKNFKIRGIKARRTYSAPEAAAAIGSCTASIWKWTRCEGLQVYVAGPPALYLGHDLVEFIVRRQARKKVKLAGDEFNCFRCKVARTVRTETVQVFEITATLRHVKGSCGVCGATCNRRFGLQKLQLSGLTPKKP